MSDVGGGVEPVDIAQQKHPLPRHQHVVEKDDAVHLFEAGGERVVEMRAAGIDAVAAQEAQPLGAARDRKGERERAVPLGVTAHARRIDGDLVGERPQGGEDAGAAHDDAGIGFAHDL